MSFLEKYEFSEKLEKLVDVADYMAMTREELLEEVKFMAKMYKSQADCEEQKVAAEIEALYEVAI